MMEWLDGLQKWRLWLSLAYQDIRNKYRRSVLGPFWITLTMGVTIMAMGPLYGGLFGGQEKYFVPKMGIGLVVWSLISSSVNDFVECFVGASHFIKNVKLPLSVYVYRVIGRQLILFLHNALLLLPMYAFYPELLGFHALWALLGLALLLVWLSQFGTMIAVFCTRYRDLGPLVTNITQLLFFVTPIVWSVSQLGAGRALVVEANPFYYLLEFIRMPLLGEPFQPGAMWLVVPAFFVLSVCLYLAAGKGVKKLAYWL